MGCKDRRTDGRVDRQDLYCGFLERPHKNSHFVVTDNFNAF